MAEELATFSKRVALILETKVCFLRRG